ncbi:hypothetical protein EHS25_005377 [Saitozyma podzolica]|uniref:Transcription factor domain-containing protein n=1 Tax=Saitozyma podzolica TaxID=1890683 RepID=A0A427XY66_9TREE|nr:hypothetical protein EHS25_005377 [Saitozyma podzolica]
MLGNPNQSPSMATAGPVIRACDQCHKKRARPTAERAAQQKSAEAESASPSAFLADPTFPSVISPTGELLEQRAFHTLSDFGDIGLGDMSTGTASARSFDQLLDSFGSVSMPSVQLGQPLADTNSFFNPFGQYDLPFDVESWLAPPPGQTDDVPSWVVRPVARFNQDTASPCPKTTGDERSMARTTAQEVQPLTATQPLDPSAFGDALGSRTSVSTIVPIIFDSVILPQLDIFYERLHDIVPILPKHHTLSRATRGDYETSIDFASLLLAMAALALIQPVVADEAYDWERSTRQAQRLVDEACRLKGLSSSGENIGIDNVLSSFLLSLCLLGLGRLDAAWFRLREALVLAEAMQAQERRSVGTGLQVDEVERIRRQRLYGVLALTERSYALLQHQRLSYGAGSGATRILPTDLSNGETDDPSHKRAVFGLSALMRLFCFIDETVIGCWSDTNHQPEDCGLTRDKVINLQRELDRALDTSQTALSKSSMATGDVSEIRKADLLVTQQWLKNRVWKLSLSHNFVEVGSRVAELSAVYPVAIGNATLSSCLALSMRSAEANGLAWVEKLYDIAQTIVSLHALDSALLDQPVAPSTESSGKAHPLAGRETLQQLLAQITTFRAGRNPYFQKLKDDMARLGV